jgi:hypothetical protein
MVNKMATIELSQEGSLFITACYTLQLLNFNVKFFALNYIPSCVFTKIAR